MKNLIFAAIAATTMVMAALTVRAQGDTGPTATDKASDQEPTTADLALGTALIDEDGKVGKVVSTGTSLYGDDQVGQFYRIRWGDSATDLEYSDETLQKLLNQGKFKVVKTGEAKQQDIESQAPSYHSPPAIPTSDSAQQPGPAQPPEFHAILIDVEMHVSKGFSQEEELNLWHVINQEFLKRNSDVAVFINAQQGDSAYSDLRVDVFLSKAVDKSTGAAKEYGVFVAAFDKAKLRKKLGAGGLTDQQITQWTDDKQFPVLEFDYADWTICPSEKLGSTLASIAQKINDQLLPEVRANITKLSTLRIFPSERAKPNEQ